MVKYITYRVHYSVMNSKIWVTCTYCDSSDSHALYGSKPEGVGYACPSCGSSWKDNEIIDLSSGKSLSAVMGNVSPDLNRDPPQVIWLEPQSGKM